MAGERDERTGAAAGCGMALLSIAAGCLLLVVNGLLLAGLYRGLSASGAPLPRGGAAPQFVMFVGPVLLLFAEWWLFDRISGWVRRRRMRGGR